MEKWDIYHTINSVFFQQVKGKWRGEWEKNKRKGKGDKGDEEAEVEKIRKRNIYLKSQWVIISYKDNYRSKV